MISGISPITSTTGATAASAPTPPSRAVEERGSSFSAMLHSLEQQSVQLDSDAARSVTGLLRGDGTDVHQAMIATQKADIAFELAMQVRNRVVNAYQQLMQMQF